MSVKKGLKDIKKFLDNEEAKFAERREAGSTKARWFGIQDKEKVKILFLQEFDDESENFSKKNGVVTLSVEHSNPQNFKRKAVCTSEDEDACWACEQHKKDWKAGWKPKNRLYVNVLVDNGKDEPYVAVLSQGTSDKSITPALMEYAETGSITDKWYTIKRNGKDFNNTSYLLLPSTDSKENVEDYELFDLDRLLYKVPYEKQEVHYLDGETLAVVDDKAEDTPPWAASGAKSSSDSGDDTW